MLLFKPYFQEAIWRGLKTQTRRNHKKQRCKVGSLQQCRTTLFGKPFAIIRVKRVWRERLADITPDEVRAEGFPSPGLAALTPAQFITGFRKIASRHVTRRSKIYVYEFETVECFYEDLGRV